MLSHVWMCVLCNLPLMMHKMTQVCFNTNSGSILSSVDVQLEHWNRKAESKLQTPQTGHPLITDLFPFAVSLRSRSVHSPWHPVPECVCSALWVWGRRSLSKPCARLRCLHSTQHKHTSTHTAAQTKMAKELTHHTCNTSACLRTLQRLTLWVGAHIEFHTGRAEGGLWKRPASLFPSGTHDKSLRLKNRQRQQKKERLMWGVDFLLLLLFCSFSFACCSTQEVLASGVYRECYHNHTHLCWIGRPCNTHMLANTCVTGAHTHTHNQEQTQRQTRRTGSTFSIIFLLINICTQ